VLFIHICLCSVDAGLLHLNESVVHLFFHVSLYQSCLVVVIAAAVVVWCCHAEAAVSWVLVGWWEVAPGHLRCHWWGVAARLRRVQRGVAGTHDRCTAVPAFSVGTLSYQISLWFCWLFVPMWLIFGVVLCLEYLRHFDPWHDEEVRELTTSGEIPGTNTGVVARRKRWASCSKTFFQTTEF